MSERLYQQAELGSPLLLPVPVPCLLALPFLPLGSLFLVARLFRAFAKAAHGGLPSWRPQGLSLSASLPAAFSVFIVVLVPMTASRA